MSVTKYLLLTFFCACALSAISQRKNISGSLYISRLSRLNFKCDLLGVVYMYTVVCIMQYFQSLQQALLSGFREKKNRRTTKTEIFLFRSRAKKLTKSPPSPLSFHVLCSKNACYEVLIILLLFFLTLNQWTFLIFGSQCSLTNVRCS